ncbi:MAG TPA: D-alanyl-D-alanine carboxypeptidase/D-alanyl-D-alanine-endopeptidase [Fimbriimonas sp.]|nr:D-alanyl-D-alanine carboxypeptidase/D-alanyl-D-alanine-endopeptidase [Fimbriimonas sp.]
MFGLLALQAASWNSLIDVPEFKGATVCVTVRDDAGNIVFDRNGDRLILPASNEKLFTGAFALYELGPDYRPVTSFWNLGDRVVVDSPGDPSVSYGQLKDLSASLGSSKMPVFVHQAYDPEIPDEWETGDLPNRYAAPVSAFSGDQNGFELWNRGGKLRLEPSAFGVKTRHRNDKAPRPSYAYDPVRRTLTVTGSFPDKDERLDTLAVPNGTEAAASVFGELAGSTDNVPTDRPTAILVGKPFSEVLTECLRESDNNMAENFLLMGASHEGPLPQDDPYGVATKRLTEFLQRVVDLDPDEVTPHDGSGLSRYNHVTTQAVTKLLLWAKKQPTMAVWMNALAAPGLGTLRHRLQGVDFKGKTGSLSYVTALSGYLVTSEPKNLTVSVIVNNFTCSEGQAHGVIDRFVKFISEKVP